MPPEGACEKARRDICSLEELVEISRAAIACGIRKIRLTGGEPLVRRGIVDLCRQLRALPGLETLGDDDKRRAAARSGPATARSPVWQSAG